jgi:hypothetical protein
LENGMHKREGIPFFEMPAWYLRNKNDVFFPLPQHFTSGNTLRAGHSQK